VLVQESVDFAEVSPFPDKSEAYKDVYVEEDYPFIEE
jgi:pyruvate dehydrogenase E1 component alpha subunit